MMGGVMGGAERSLNCGSAWKEQVSCLGPGLVPTTSATFSTSSQRLHPRAQVAPPSVGPSTSGKNLSLMSKPKSQTEESRRPSSALFLRQFQEQMSQMKDAMDQVQKEIFSSCAVPSRGRGRPSKSLIHQPQNPTYHSQISHTNGLVLRIRKAGIPSLGRRGPKKKRRKVDEDVVYCGDSEEEEEPRRRRKEEERTMEAWAGSGWGNSLPLDLLRRILAHVVEMEGAIPSLLRASLVSRLWREASLEPSLWTSVDLSTGKVKDRYRSERNLTYFLENKFSYVTNLNLGGWSSAVTHEVVGVLVRVCPHLETLNLSTCYKLSAQNVKSLAACCARLSKLDLSAVSSVYNTRNAVSPAGIGEGAQLFAHRLLNLSLASNCMGNLPQVLTSLAHNCLCLEVLDLSNINSPRRDAIAIRIEELQIGCPALRVLRLTNSDIVLGEVSMKDRLNSPGFLKLEELSIAVDPKRSQGMDDNDLERIVKKSVRLRLLDARGCGRISDSGLVRLPAWDLEHLYLSGSSATKASQDGLELIFRKWRHSFKEIDISWTPSEETIELALKALAEGTTTPLSSLDLSGSSVSFESVRLLLRTSPFLQTLNLASCRALPRGIKRNYQTPHELHSLREQILSQETNDATS